MRATSVWIVEINFKDGRGWYATVGIGLTREQGRYELERWKEHNPDEFVRLRKYQRA